MSRVFQALTAEPWAIEPSWLAMLAALAQRDHSAPEVEAMKGWQARDYDLLAGPGAQRLAGAQRAFVIDGVAVIPIMGPIFPRANMMTEMSGATSVSMLQNDHRVAMANPDVFAILPLFDTPGGQVSGIASFHDTLAAGAKLKPTVAHVAGSAASAGYWIASAANEIAVERTSILGSIGVVAAVPKQVAPDDKGVMAIEIVSTNAPKKRLDPETDDGQADIRSYLDAIETHMIADIAKGRKTTAARVIADFGQGGVKVGADAKSAGMADKVQSYETTLGQLRRIAANQRKLTALKT